MASKLNVQLKSQYLDASDLIKILGFLPVSETASEANGIHDVAAMWLFQ